MENAITTDEKLVAVTSESTYGENGFGGSPPTVFLAFDEFEVSQNFGRVTNNEIYAVHSGAEDEVFGDYLEISFTLPLTMAPGGGDPPPWAALLKASNMEETITASTSAAYHPVTGSDQARVPSSTAVVYMIEAGHENARRMDILGARYNLTLNFQMGEYARIQGQGRAPFVEFPDATVAKPDNPTVYSGNQQAVRVVGAVAKIGTTTVDLESLEISTNWDFYEERSASSPAGGVESVELRRPRGGNNVQGSLTLKGRGFALNTLVPELQDGGVMALEITLEQGARTFVLEAPLVKFTGATKNKDGRLKFDLGYICIGNFADGGGENDFSLTFS